MVVFCKDFDIVVREVCKLRYDTTTESELHLYTVIAQ